MKGSCHCGAVTLEVPGPPDYLNQCNCTVCWKLGTLWGYYLAEAVTLAGSPTAYVRADNASGDLAFHFCATCGAVTHWGPTPGADYARRGINMRLFDPGELTGIEVRYGDRRNHAQVEPRRYARPASVFGSGGVPA